jgi:preprotein translocase subunit SecA
VAAYEQKAAAVDDIEPGLMQEAQKFFVLTQTDNLWKEHLQVRPGTAVRQLSRLDVTAEDQTLSGGCTAVAKFLG